MDWKNHDPQTLLGELQSGDDDRSERAVHRVAELGERMLPLLLEQLQSQEPDQRWWATAALTHIDREEARKALLESLADEDTAVRQCAAFGLRRHPYVDAIPTLLDLLGDDDRLLARLAADALAALGECAVSPLTEALRSEDAAVRIEAARALASIDDPSVIAPLFTALDDDSSLVTHWAEEGLQRRGVGMVFFKPS
ncbi:MAG: HEAT repeat domain-containing protein [Anaerolineales bacterium]|jgi:HEAT repeat protein|nr:MAG: HEAT repeat domain-containing protein [Anaerolineales bacterium]